MSDDENEKSPAQGDDGQDLGERRNEKHYSPHYQANNAGGYGNPPVKGQFRKGDPGGPGRPKGRGNLESAISRVMSKPKTVNRNGRPTKMMPTEIFAERVLEAILSNNKSPGMLEYGRKLFDKYGPKKPEEPIKFDASGLSKDDLNIIICILGFVAGGEPFYPEPSPLLRKRESQIEGIYRVARREDGHLRFEKLKDRDEHELYG